MSVNEDFTEVQAELKDTIFVEGDKFGKTDDSLKVFAQQIADFSPDIIRLVASEGAANMLKFLKVVDLNHPEVSAVVSSEGCQSILQTLDVAQYTYEKPLGLAWPKVRAMASREIKSIFASVDEASRTMVRIIQEPEQRNATRKRKSYQKIGLESAVRSQDGLWDNLPETFKPFVRFGKYRQDAIAKAKGYAERYKNMGCQKLYSEVEKSLSILEGKKKDSFIGFYRITLQEAGLILAKIHGCQYNPNTMESVSLFSFKKEDFPFVINQSVNVASKSLDDWANATTYAGLESAVKKVATKDTPMVLRSYNYFDLEEIASEQTKAFIAHLDNLPELNGKPSFDHYVVMLPTADMSSPNWSTNFSYTNDKNETKNFSRSEVAQRSMDVELVEKKFIRPVIMGEREGKCYFISYFEAK